MEKNNKKDNQDIAHYVFSGSTTMIGVCITVIALFRVMNISIKTYADEILGIDTLIFILATLLSYITLRNDQKNIERFADIFFFIGMGILIFVGILIIFSTF